VEVARKVEEEWSEKKCSIQKAGDIELEEMKIMANRTELIER